MEFVSLYSDPQERLGQTPSTGLRHPSLEDGAGKRCSEFGVRYCFPLPHLLGPRSPPVPFWRQLPLHRCQTGITGSEFLTKTDALKCPSSEDLLNRTETLSYLNCVKIRVQELCESGGGRPGLPVLMSLTISEDVKQHRTMLRRLSLMSTDIRGHEALHHHM